jgi:hypothetical protein
MINQPLDQQINNAEGLGIRQLTQMQQTNPELVVGVALENLKQELMASERQRQMDMMKDSAPSDVIGQTYNEVAAMMGGGGQAPMGQAPMGQAPMGQAPMGQAPMGLPGLPTDNMAMQTAAQGGIIGYEEGGLLDGVANYISQYKQYMAGLASASTEEEKQERRRLWKIIQDRFDSTIVTEAHQKMSTEGQSGMDGMAGGGIVSLQEGGLLNQGDKTETGEIIVAMAGPNNGVPVTEEEYLVFMETGQLPPNRNATFDNNETFLDAEGTISDEDYTRRMRNEELRGNAQDSSQSVVDAYLGNNGEGIASVVPPSESVDPQGQGIPSSLNTSVDNTQTTEIYGGDGPDFLESMTKSFEEDPVDFAANSLMALSAAVPALRLTRGLLGLAARNKSLSLFMAGLGTKIYNSDYVQEQLKTLDLGEDLEAVTAEIAKATDTGASIDITEGDSQAPRSDEETLTEIARAIKDGSASPRVSSPEGNKDDGEGAADEEGGNNWLGKTMGVLELLGQGAGASEGYEFSKINEAEAAKQAVAEANEFDMEKQQAIIDQRRLEAADINELRRIIARQEGLEEARPRIVEEIKDSQGYLDKEKELKETYDKWLWGTGYDEAAVSAGLAEYIIKQANVKLRIIGEQYDPETGGVNSIGTSADTAGSRFIITESN